MKRLIAWLLLLTLAATQALAQDLLCRDDGCVLPTATEQGEPVYGIVSPVGYHDVEMIAQAARPDTLDGKVIALVGGSFMAPETMPVLRECILAEYPTATVYLPAEVGNAGPFSVGGQTEKTRAFQQRLKELQVDVVVVGNCGCGLCTMKETGSAIAAEYIGIPSVAIGAPSFIQQIHSTGVNRGVPVLRAAEYPGAFAAHTPQELEDNTRQIVWPQVKAALTTPITQEEIALYARASELPYDQIVFDGTYDEVQEFCLVSGWSDGLPIVPPTQERVEEYLRFCAFEGGDLIGVIPPSYRRTYAYTVAANAVMAGVPKEFMPICMAFAQCMENGEWRRPLASTHGWSPYAWLNGPLARQLGVDCGQGMISEARNRALGRFIDLCMLNLGGYYVKENRMGTFGYLSAFTFSEDEEACRAIGWQPYHVTRGYDLNSSTLTAASALAWGNNVTPATSDPAQIMTLLAWDITEKQQNGLGNTNPQVYRTVFITEYVARDLAAGYASKEALEDALVATARRPLYMRAYALYYASTGSQQTDRYTFRQFYGKLRRDPDEQAALTPVPAWLKEVTTEAEIWTIATMNRGQTALLVTGDADRNKFQVMPGGGCVTVEIRLPDNWDELLAPLGYAPLETFFLE